MGFMTSRRQRGIDRVWLLRIVLDGGSTSHCVTPTLSPQQWFDIISQRSDWTRVHTRGLAASTFALTSPVYCTVSETVVDVPPVGSLTATV